MRHGTFEEWKDRVDEIVERTTGLDTDGLPDYDYQDAYNRGIAPSKAAVYVIRNARGY